MLTRRLLFEQDPCAVRENAEMDHRRGEVLQSGGSEVGRDVRQIRRRGAASAPRRSLKEDHSENDWTSQRDAAEGV